MANRFVPAVLGALLAVATGCGGNGPAQPTVIPSAPPPPPQVRQGTFAVDAGTSRVTAGTELTVSWTASQPGKLDWISLFRITATNLQHDGWYDYVGGEPSGTFTLKAPMEPGQYEFRYLLDDGYVDVARSRPVTIEPK